MYQKGYDWFNKIKQDSYDPRDKWFKEVGIDPNQVTYGTDFYEGYYKAKTEFLKPYKDRFWEILEEFDDTNNVIVGPCDCDIQIDGEKYNFYIG